MSQDHGSSGGGQPPPEMPPELQRLLEMQLNVISTLIPGMPDQYIFAAFQAATNQEEGLAPVWADALEGPKPYIAMQLSRAKKDGPSFVVYARKRIEGQVTAAEFRDICAVYGALASPLVRALLLASGWLIQFAPSNGPAQTKLIL